MNDLLELIDAYGRACIREGGPYSAWQSVEGKDLQDALEAAKAQPVVPQGWTPTSEILMRQIGGEGSDFMAPQRLFKPGDSFYDAPAPAVEPVPPYDTGKVKIGLLYERKAEMDADAEIIQGALLNTRKTS